MPSARDIADERLARGEITPDQHAEIVARLGQTGPAGAVPPAVPPSVPPAVPTLGPPAVPVAAPRGAHAPAAPVAAAPAGGVPSWFWPVGAVVSVVFIAIVVYAVKASEGLSVGNIRSVARTVHFTVANTSVRSGDAVFWVSQNGLSMCESVLRMPPNQRYDVTRPCATLAPGDTFTLHIAWSDTQPDRAAVATRVNVN